MSKVLPISGPRTTSARVATYHFYTKLMISVLTLRFEAFQPSHEAPAGEPLACPP